MEKTINNAKISKRTRIAAKAIAVIAAIAAAVALPQLFHAFGTFSGTGNLLAAAFLPMHLAVLTVGLIAGPAAGAITGAASPLISFILSGMPQKEMLPFMIIELAIYGLACGLGKKSKMPLVLKVLFAQVLGRLVKLAVIGIAVYAFNNAGPTAVSVLESVITGLPGILLQLLLLPLLAYRLKFLDKYYV